MQKTSSSLFILLFEWVLYKKRLRQSGAAALLYLNDQWALRLLGKVAYLLISRIAAADTSTRETSTGTRRAQIIMEIIMDAIITASKNRAFILADCMEAVQEQEEAALAQEANAPQDISLLYIRFIMCSAPFRFCTAGIELILTL